ncbi:hypothetical protein [Streptomyces sp. NPDC049881]|uniref:hypothetical protein n=1 Tax=Streptomyces sp. NPDC049881 TaxID=3155778 RepID=UPI003449F358
MATITVARHDLSISARETITEALRRFDTQQGNAWSDLMRALACQERAVFITGPDRFLRPSDVPLYTAPPVDVLEMPWRGRAHEAVTCLIGAGYLPGEPAMLRRNDAHDTYLDTGRFFEAATVLKPFKAAFVAYEGTRTLIEEIVLRAGTYVIASTGLVRRTIHGIGYTKVYPVTLPGEGVSLAQAECRACSRRWWAKDGSWWFRPEHARDAPWSYAAAEDHRDGTVACPVPSCSGRVGFRIV